MDGLISQPPAPNRFELQPFPAGDILERAVVRFGALPALDFLGRKWTYKQLGDLANRAAAGLQKLGVMKGVNVGLCLPNSPYYVIMYFAILKAGGTVVNFNPLYTEHEIRTQAEQSHTAIMVSMDLRMIHEKIRPLAGDGLFKRVVICRMARILTPRDAILFRLFKGRELSRVANNAPYVPFERLLDSAALPGAIEIDPDYLEARASFAGMLLDIGNTDESVRQLNFVAQRDPNKAQALYLLAEAYRIKEAYAESIKAARQAIQITPNNAEAHFWLAESLRMSGDYDAAQSEYDQYLRLSNFDSKLAGKLNYYVLGYLVGMGHKTRASQKDIWSDLRSSAYFGLCDCDRKLKRYDDAIDFCTQSLRYDAKDAYVHYALGLIYAHKAQDANSREMLAAACQQFRIMLALNDQMAEADQVKKMLVSFDAKLAK